VREPFSRLMSQYSFWRAHTSSARNFHIGMEHANRLDPAAFFNLDEVTKRFDVWNHMTWCVMGNRLWRQWRAGLDGTSGKARRQLLDSYAIAIRARLLEFAFVGLTEDFSRSCELLFERMGRPKPEDRFDHSLDALKRKHQYFKDIPTMALTDEIKAAMSPVTELDEILYAEARQIYSSYAAQPATQVV